MQKVSSGVILLLALAMPFSGSAAEKGLTVYWCDVEGGAATLIVTPAGESLLVDAGWPGERDADRIARIAREMAGLTRIDHLITTHFHTDHFGGIEPLSRLIPVKNFYGRPLPQPLPKDIPSQLVEPYRRVTGDKVVMLRAGDEIPLRQVQGAPRVTLKILASGGRVEGEAADAPQVRECAVAGHEAKPVDESDNARSIAMLLTVGGWKFFDGADITWNVEHKLFCPQDLVGAVDVYQVTHHGLAQSNHPGFLQVLRPRVAIMNNGARKGGAAAAIQVVMASTGAEGFFALHRNVAAGPSENALPAMTANDELECRGGYVLLSLAPDAKSYTVSVPGKSTEKVYQTR